MRLSLPLEDKMYEVIIWTFNSFRHAQPSLNTDYSTVRILKMAPKQSADNAITIWDIAVPIYIYALQQDTQSVLMSEFIQHLR